MIDITRVPGDILAGVVRVTLGGQTYALPVRSIRANRDWRATLDSRTTSLLDGLTATGDDLGTIFELLAAQADDLIDMLVAYDTSGVLPTKDEIEAIEPDASVQVLVAVREVWRASNPLVAIAVGAAAEASSPPTSSSAPPMDSAAPATSMTA